MTTEIELRRIGQLTDADWTAWLDIQRSSGVYESPYFRPEFTRAVASVRDDVEVAVLQHGGSVQGFFPFQRGSLNLGKPVGGKLSDYHGPLVRPNCTLDGDRLLRGCRLASWDFDHFVTAGAGLDLFIMERQGSAQLDLSQGYETFARSRREAGSEAIHKQGQKTRKMIREVGPLNFAYDADDDEAYSLLRSWKSAQFVQTGLADVFAFPWTAALLAKLREQRGQDFSAPLTVLRAGDKVAAVCLSLRSGGILHGWFTAYNPELHVYSPGMTLFVRLAEDAPGLGIRKIDLGKGKERYKWSLASGSVDVGEGSISSRSLATMLRTSWRQTRDWVARSPLAGRAPLSGRLLKPLREWFAYH